MGKKAEMNPGETYLVNDDVMDEMEDTDVPDDGFLDDIEKSTVVPEHTLAGKPEADLNDTTELEQLLEIEDAESIDDTDTKLPRGSLGW